jgi:hypothetical protein
MVGDVCAGVPNAPICEEDYCTQGVACASVVEVGSGSAFADAVAGAQAGTCIALGPGTYGAVILPDGVSLLGKGADFVKIASVEIGGFGVRVRGVSVESGSVSTRGGDAVIEGVRITASPEDGIHVGGGGSVTINNSEVRAAERYGVSAFDAARVEVDASIIDGKDGQSGPGLWAQCGDGCNCTATPDVKLSNTKLVGNSIVGLSLVGVAATLTNVEVSNTQVGGNFEAGGGISASACSTVSATSVSIIDNLDFGFLIDDSSIDMDGFTVSGNLRGVWIQNIGMSMAATATVRNGVVTDNQGVGIGVAAASEGVTVVQTTISGTKAIALPVLVNGVSAGSEEVGDGLTWKGASQVSLDSVTVSSSARASVLIDGEVGSGSTIDNVVLSYGDELRGILQQNLPTGGAQPAVSGSPPITTSATEQFAVPADISIPPTI